MTNRRRELSFDPRIVHNPEAMKAYNAMKRSDLRYNASLPGAVECGECGDLKHPGTPCMEMPF
jgi:ribosomal protein L32